MAKAPLNITARRRIVRLRMKSYSQGDALWAQLLAGVKASHGLSFVRLATNCVNNRSDEQRMVADAVY